MKLDELLQLRKEFINGNSSKLGDFYLEFKEDCKNVLLSKNLCDPDKADGIFSEALIILHKNIILGKIVELSSVKSYLISTCINLAKKIITAESNTQKKINEIRLLFYEYNDTSVDNNEFNKNLIKICKTAMNLLTVRCQKIITAYYIYRLSMKEIAEELELSSSDVAKTLKSRCYGKLLKEVRKLRT